MKVLIINQHTNNFGDDAAGTALLNMLLQRDDIEDVDILYNSEDALDFEDPKVHHDLQLSFRKIGYKNIAKYYLLQRPFHKKSKSPLMNEYIALIKNSDVVFMSPCGANIGIYKHWVSLARVVMVVLEKKKMIFQYNTIGKSGNFLFDTIAKWALKRSKIYVREKKSYKYLQDRNIFCKWGPDTAFALPQCTDAIREDVVSLVPSSFDGWHPEFKGTPVDAKVQSELLPQLAKWAQERHLKIEILPHLGIEKEKKYNLAVMECLRKAGAEQVTLREDVLTMWDYDKAIGTSRYVVGMRYHTIVLASKNARPYLSLCYENKMWEVCKYTHMKECGYELHNLVEGKSTDITSILNYIEKNETQISDTLRQTVNKELIPMVEIPLQENL